MHMRAHDVHRVLMRVFQGPKPRGGPLVLVTSCNRDVSLRRAVRFPGDDQAFCEVTGKSKHIMCQCKTERGKNVGLEGRGSRRDARMKRFGARNVM